MRKYYAVATMFLVLVVMWVVTGITTQVDRVCTSCHIDTPHVEEAESDPHKDVSCARCHENYGVIGSVTVSVPVRLAHIVVGTFKETGVPGYQSYPDDACYSCHAKEIDSGVTYDSETGIKMSHKEPTQAGMTCMQCHILDSDQKVTYVTNGMQPCLKCHNGTLAAASCSSCHSKSPTIVARTESSPDNAQPLVPPQTGSQSCYECHDPRPCDSCHGVRMPHVDGYTDGGPQHVADSKKYGVRMCFKCHVAPSWYTGASSGRAVACETCHGVLPDGTVD